MMTTTSAIRTSFPRRRGDGPIAGTVLSKPEAFPPQARGWTSGREVQAVPAQVSPAGAGMDRASRASAAGRFRFPRRRGDGPVSAFAIGRFNMFPPQARGWTLGFGCLDLRAAVSPAGAGMDPGPPRRSRSRSCFPRRRGDGPAAVVVGTAPALFPPQARGWTAAERIAALAARVSPAGAGMDPERPTPPHDRRRFPRRRGDGPSHRLLPNRQGKFPPQARGWTRDRTCNHPNGVVSPAGAGMDLRDRLHPRMGRGFPRRRGDGPVPRFTDDGQGLFPPQARGWTRRAQDDRPGLIVSPAGAGMDPRLRQLADDSSGFPRRRGDGPHERHEGVLLGQFPPQARGWTGSGAGQGRDHPVSPAGAGMDPASRPRGSGGRCFPRRRGDGPLPETESLRVEQFPPQARGWTDQQDRPGPRASVSPVGAGMDPARSRGGPAAARCQIHWAHTRTCFPHAESLGSDAERGSWPIP